MRQHYLVHLSSLAQGVEPASCYQKVAGLISLVCMSKFPWARYWTPNCSWCAVHRHQCMNVCMNFCKWFWSKASAKCCKCKCSLEAKKESKNTWVYPAGSQANPHQIFEVWDVLTWTTIKNIWTALNIQVSAMKPHCWHLSKLLSQETFYQILKCVYFWPSRFGHIFRRPIKKIHYWTNVDMTVFLWQSNMCFTHSITEK